MDTDIIETAKEAVSEDVDLTKTLIQSVVIIAAVAGVAVGWTHLKKHLAKRVAETIVSTDITPE